MSSFGFFGELLKISHVKGEASCELESKCHLYNKAVWLHLYVSAAAQGIKHERVLWRRSRYREEGCVYMSVVTCKALTDNLTAFVLLLFASWCTFKRVSRSHSWPQSCEKQQDAKASSESSCSSTPSRRSAVCFLLDDFVSLTTTESVIITAVRPTCTSRRQHPSQIEALYSSRPKHQNLMKHHMFHVTQS